MQTGLVRERRDTHVRAVRFQGDIHHLGDVMGDGRDLGQAIGVHHRNAHLQHQVGDDRGEIGVAGPLAIAVYAALDLPHSLGGGPQRRGHRAPGIVVEVDSQVSVGQRQAYLVDDPVYLDGQSPAVGVAQHQALGARLPCRTQHRQGVAGIGAIAVEEVLGVEEHPPAL